MTKVDYSVYLVTDSSLVPEGCTLYGQVEKAVKSGATIVQLREKHAETRDFIKIAAEIHELTKAHNVPLIINDRMDVALAVDAEGVHVGQDDMPVGVLKKYLPADKIIGVSVNNTQEAQQAIENGADYVGVGAVYDTSTKALKKAPLGCSGVREIVDFIAARDDNMRSVAIGGINHSNAQYVMWATRGVHARLDGVAVVSCLMGATDASRATSQMANLIKATPPWARPAADMSIQLGDPLAAKFAEVAKRVNNQCPLIHHITNDVVKHISASVTIAAGASPAMSECTPEFGDFASVPGSALLVNMGTGTTESLAMYQQAVKHYNAQGKIIVLDPVACGASQDRRATVAKLLDSGHYDVVKGNAGEIAAAAKVEGATMRGVDSIDDGDFNARLAATQKLAQTNHTVVLNTGAVDVLCEYRHNKYRTWRFENGSKYLGQITGSGCMLGSLISAYCTAYPDDTFVATAAALCIYNKAAEVAETQCTGPGTFVPALIDAVYKCSQDTVANAADWMSNVRVTQLE